MTVAEFKAWLDGYTEAGGADANRIAGQARSISEPAPFVLSPFVPTPIPGPQWFPTTTPVFPYQEPFIVSEPNMCSSTIPPLFEDRWSSA